MYCSLMRSLQLYFLRESVIGNAIPENPITEYRFCPKNTGINTEELKL